MGLVDKIKNAFGPEDPTKRRHAQHDKQIKKAMRSEERAMELSHRKNECRIMLKESEAGFKRVMDREVRNARQAMEIGVDFSLNKNQFSDAMRGIECVKRARWYMDSISSDEGLHGALRLLNQALKTMNKIDGGMKMVNTAALQRRVDNLYALENMTEDDAVLPPTQDYKYKFENGLFESMVAGMSYEEAQKASHQDLNVGSNIVGASADFGDIFASKSSEEDTVAAERRREMLESRQREL